MYAIIDVSIERLAQHFDDHILTLCLKNLKVEPLIEINHVKSKLTYLTIQLVDMNSYAGKQKSCQIKSILCLLFFPTEEPLNNDSKFVFNSVASGSSSPTKSVCNSTNTPSPLKRNFNFSGNGTKPPKLYAKITRNKCLKCKFSPNNKAFHKPVDFVLCEDHFFKITDEVLELF